MHTPDQLDIQGIYGTALSVSCLIIAQFFESVSMLSGLQTAAYIMTILIAIDTLLGNRLKQWINLRIKKFQSRRNENKSKRNKPS